VAAVENARRQSPRAGSVSRAFAPPVRGTNAAAGPRSDSSFGTKGEPLGAPTAIVAVA
jgi:hypothetical protein